MNNYKISIIIPMYNAEQYIAQCLDSVFSQTYTNYEVIVINDASQDNSANIVKQFQKEHTNLILINHAQNLNVAASRNHGVQQASGQWIAFLDADDIWHPDKLNQQIQALTNSQAQICYTSQFFINAQGQLTKKKFIVPINITYKKLLRQNVIGLSSAVVRKDLCLKYPFTHDELHEDFIFWLQILKHEPVKVIGLTEPLTDYRLTPKSKSRNKLKSVRMTYLTYKRVGLNFWQRHYYLMFYLFKGLKKYR